MKQLLIALSMLISTSLFAQNNKNCISQANLKDISSHFTQFAKYANKDFCADGSADFQLLSSMMFMRSTAFAANMAKSQDDFFSGRFAKDWYGYFIGRIDSIKVEASCPKGALAFVQAFFGFSDKVMHVCPIGLTDAVSTLDLSSVFMHEARHIDGFPHITCSKGPRAGINGACDKIIADGGSYAVTVETYAQLAKYATALHPALKAYARASSAIYGQEAFETPITVQNKNELVLMMDNLDFVSVDIATLATKTMGKSPVVGKIFKRANHMVLIPDDKTLPGQYVFLQNEGPIAQSPSDMITEYNAQTPAEKAKLVDVHVAAQWNAKVFKNSIRFVCDPTSPATKDIALPAGKNAANLLYVDGYARANFSALLSTENGEIFELGCSNKAAYLKVSAVKFDQKYKRVYKINNRIFGLTFSGELFTIENGKSTAVKLSKPVLEMAPNQIFTFM